MKRCMYCGHENDDAAATCSVCGNKLGVSIPTVDSVVEEVSLDEASETPEETPAPAEEHPVEEESGKEIISALNTAETPAAESENTAKVPRKNGLSTY